MNVFSYPNLLIQFQISLTTRSVVLDISILHGNAISIIIKTCHQWTAISAHDFVFLSHVLNCVK